MKKIAALTFVWLVLVMSGFAWLSSRSSQAGAAGASTSQWPVNSKLHHSKKNELVVFLHPGCNCSMATLSELSRLVAQHDNVVTKIIFMRSQKLDQLFNDNALLAKAKLVPRSEIFFDRDGQEAKTFGAETSGQTYLYSPERSLVFSGGLTMARGHEGRSQSQETIHKYLNGQKITRSIASVFGCELFKAIQ